MKFLTAQGHFGVLDGRQIRFEDGLNVLYLPNEGGKTTLCNFLRVMLYGINTSKRDTAINCRTRRGSVRWTEIR